MLRTSTVAPTSGLSSRAKNSHVGAQLAAFVGVSLVVIVVPGQDTALTIRNTLFGGRRSGVLTAAGVSTGQACWTLAASAGVVALLQASEPAFLALRLAGAAYLVVLGVQALAGALRGRLDGGLLAESPMRGRTPRAAFRQGLVSNLGNPKMAVFFTSLLPQFGASFAALAAFGLLFCTLTLLWLSVYAVVVARAGDLLRRAKVRRWIEGITGGALVALGLRLAAER
jgi:threonine/homoserine/homoserine lactone efflux protein